MSKLQNKENKLIIFWSIIYYEFLGPGLLYFQNFPLLFIYKYTLKAMYVPCQLLDEGKNPYLQGEGHDN